MYIRCGSCHGSVWLEMGTANAAPASFTCSTCGKQYRLDSGCGGEDGGDHLADAARRLVRETKLDLPSAYSVLLGVMTLEEAWELTDPSSPTCRTAPEGPAHVHSKMPAYDPEFQAAVLAGHLTPLQAMQRGRRQSYAALLAKRHRLSEEASLEVADNKISALEAIRRRGPEPGPPVELRVPAERARSSPTWVVAGLALTAFVAFALFRMTRPSGTTVEGENALRTVLGAQVHTDQWGRILDVSASDPRTVLLGYCAADREKRFEPVDVVPSPQEGSDGRLGLMRRAGRSGEILAIDVREDRTGNRWVAGDGNSPLVPHTAPRAAAEALEQH